MTTAISASRAATDPRHRIRHPNSRPRTVVVAGLGVGGQRRVAALETGRVPHVRVVGVPARDPATAGPLLDRIAEHADDLARALEGADMIFVVCEPGDDVGYAAPIARIAHHRGLLLTGIVIGKSGEGGAHLDALRRACDLIVVSSDEATLDSMLDALGPA